MRLIFPTAGAAQAFCDKTHAQLVATNPEYAKSTAAGQTARWDAPRQNFDDKGNALGDFYVFVQDRCRPTMTPGEDAAIVTTESKPP